MADRSPRQALDAFVARMRRTLQCVADADIRGSGLGLGWQNNVQLIPRGGPAGNTVALRMRGGGRDLLLGVYLDYGVVPGGERSENRFDIVIVRYMYEVLDREGRELFAYHRHPDGPSDVRFPHLHIAAAPLVLPASLTDREPRRVAVDRAHFPTGPIDLEDVIALLVREFGVQPRRDDWQTVLEGAARGRR